MHTDQDADYRLDMIDPRADLCVMLDILRGTSGFVRGEALRQNWEHSDIQRIHTGSSIPTPVSIEPTNPWHRIRCPDGSILFIKFLSLEYRLLNGAIEPSRGEDMPDTKKKPAPPTKKKSAAPKPVASPKTGKVAKPPKAPKAPGNYKWLLHRLKAQATQALSTESNRGTIREGLKTANNYLEVRSFLQRAEIGDDKIDQFLNVFFDASINR